MTAKDKARVKAKRGSRDKVRSYRERMRAKGLRPVQIWAPDTRSPAFAAQAHRQSLAVARGTHAREDQDFIDALHTPAAAAYQ